MLFIFAIPFLIVATVAYYLNPRTKKCIKNKHVVITGGSSGIGKAFAILSARRGAHITILARNTERLKEAQDEIRSECINESQKINQFSVDVTDCEAISKLIDEIDKSIEPIYMLVNCAGLAICGEAEEISEQDMRTLIDVNVYGTLHPVRAVIPKFKKRCEGIIVLTGSQAGLIGLYGYSIYSACKFALRGFAEAMYMEVKPFNISVTLALPPDTETPGFEQENQTKPEETKILSESGGLYKPSEVASKMLDDALSGHFLSYLGTASAFLTILCVGMSRFSSFLELLLQSLGIGLFRLIGGLLLLQFETVVNKCHKAKQAEMLETSETTSGSDQEST